jgi:hypothetical protein
MRLRNRTVQQGADQNVIEGIRKDLQGLPALYLGRRQFTPTSLEDFIQARIDAASAILAAKAAWEKAVADYEAAAIDTDLVVRDLQGFVVGAFGDDSPVLADFGFTPRKLPLWTEEKKAAAVKKRAATRVARGTRGPKAKLAITGAPPATAATATPEAPSGKPPDTK